MQFDRLYFYIAAESFESIHHRFSQHHTRGCNSWSAYNLQIRSISSIIVSMVCSLILQLISNLLLLLWTSLIFNPFNILGIRNPRWVANMSFWVKLKIGNSLWHFCSIIQRMQSSFQGHCVFLKCKNFVLKTICFFQKTPNNPLGRQEYKNDEMVQKRNLVVAIGCSRFDGSISTSFWAKLVITKPTQLHRIHY